MTSSKAYLKLFNACPIKVGDTVRVLRGWKDGEYGYVCGMDYDVDTPRLDTDYVVIYKYNHYYEIGIPTKDGKRDVWYVPFFVLEVVKSALSTIATSDDYLAFHEASGLKVGDKVKITRKSDDYEMGWDNTWSNNMDNCVGDVGEIICDEYISGWLISVCGITRDYPTFVLQKIDEPTKKEVVAKLTTNKIVVKENSVVINGNELTKEQVGALYYKLVRKGKKKSGVGNQMKHKVHNPDKLTPEQIGVSEGYRLLDEDEIKDRASNLCIEKWVVTSFKNPYWDNSRYQGNYTYLTYRTRLSREQLAKLK